MKELNKYLSGSFFWIGLLLLLVLGSCKKTKQDFNTDNRNITDVRKNSSVRIINLAGYNQLQVNGDTLTNYVVRPLNDPLENSYPGTKYFPDNGRLGTTWSIPQGLLINSSARLLVETKSYQGGGARLDLQVQEDAQQALDYYLLPGPASNALTAGLPDFLKIPRSIAAAPDPSHFKIRILNLTGKVTGDPRLEDLVTPLSLTWADGTPVSSETSNILPGKYSEYIELPYCTAQLKVLTTNGIQVPGNGQYMVLNPTTSTIVGTSLTYAPIKTFAPGGVYTMVVTPRQFNIPTAGTTTGETTTAYQNSLRLINDIAEPVNITYSRMQAVNALPGINGIKIMVNGKPLGAAIDYTSYTEYGTFIIGQYTIQAVNAAGTVLASTSLKPDANSNYTLWVHPDAGGKTTITAVANDLSGTLVGNATDDATYARNYDEFSFTMRFLNLCPDMPYLTLTTDNAQDFNSVYGFNTGAVNNLRPGIVPIEFPYIRAVYNANPYQIMAFRSTPAVVPGTWASDIPVLTGKDLIARPALYVRGTLPNHEPGFYTIALVGKTDAGVPTAEKAKMIIVKHSK
ncbi:protein of unknown function [Mucilaginibacter pineti]|uniref:DUF4397 domain-containing protein n=1 Tax=Mucilaginibacter pineti TaxID=1391627 RepID=A0A1G7M1V4_9SPHI|nr:DUF4397 domain-containing protein [Mucilaginibacter pineti]SDF55772.1 protein of unknown function [Mucilaginibacter pineti]